MSIFRTIVATTMVFSLIMCVCDFFTLNWTNAFGWLLLCVVARIIDAVIEPAGPRPDQRIEHHHYHHRR